MKNSALLAAYVRQQKELGMPDPVLEKGAAFMRSLRAPVTDTAVLPAKGREQRTGGPAASSRPSIVPGGALSRLTRLSPLATVQRAPVNAPQPPRAESALTFEGQLTFEQKRALFKDLYAAKCVKCPLAQGRKTFVFGAGNVDARLMIIGEAPGQEEDLQGLPFVGPAGRLLSELLAEVSIDRKTEVFITNILKCRPPGNRNPESAEILACLPLLEKQIAIVRPALLLLLGRIAAHSLLNVTESISKMRGRTYEYKGVPAVVTYHPAAILRNMEYRAPTDEDFQKIAAMLKESGQHGAS